MSHHPCSFCGTLHFNSPCPDGVKMNQTRKYNYGETPRIGDVIRLFNGSFGDGVIVSERNLHKEMESFLVYRPHVMFKQGVPIPEAEILWFSGASLREYPVYVTGASGKIENRNY